MRCTRGEKYYNNFRNNALKKYGWYAECVEFDTDYPNEFNYHTHGILENFGHPDFQVCFRIDEKILHQFMCILVVEIQNGNRFLPEQSYMGIIKDFPAKFIEAWENGRKVLRLLIPNKYGNYAGKHFSYQLIVTPPKP